AVEFRGRQLRTEPAGVGGGRGRPAQTRGPAAVGGHGPLCTLGMAVVSGEGPPAQSRAAAEPCRCGMARSDDFLSDTGAHASAAAAVFHHYAARAPRSCPAAELRCRVAGALATRTGRVGSAGKAGATLERVGILGGSFHRRGNSPAARVWPGEYA